jgi:hypothetical protein
MHSSARATNWARRPPERRRNGKIMDTILIVPPLLALIAGLIILFVPKVLNYVVAIYLILIGLIGIFPHLGGMVGN